MKSLLLKILAFAGLLMPVQCLYPQQIDLTLKYIPANNVYEVYARPDFSQNNFFLAGGSQISVLVPASVANNGISVASVNGGPWADNSQIYAPAADASRDYHGIATNGSQVNFTAGTELLLFRFSVSGNCVPGVRLYNNGSDPGSSASGLNGADFANYLSNVFDLQDYYGTNYNNGGTTCGTADNDNDGVPESSDPDDNNPCVPNPSFATCDQDNDGLTNQEEAAIGTNPTNPDTDGDGINDGTEVTNGSNPLDPCSPNATPGICDQDSDNDGVPSGIDPDDNNPCIPNPLAGLCDQDSDGLNNNQEAAIGTNPTNPDTDGDGINDGTEVNNGSNPLDACSPNLSFPTCDQDGDGLTNAQEGTAGTNPTNPDTDGDGLNDGAEVAGGSDPLNPCDPNPASGPCDQDNDGLDNSEEAAIGTNPTNPDSDGDGINDGTEVTNGTNPLNPCDPNPASPACGVAPEFELNIRFNPATCTYEAYVLPNFSATNFFIAPGTQITVVLPAVVADVALTINTINGGVWIDNSQIFAPGAAPANDFHSISSNGSTVNLVTGEEIMLFTFTLPGGQCCAEGVRIFNNDTDPQSNATGMGGGDFNNYIADAFIFDNYYEGNYNNQGTICDQCLITPVPVATTNDATQEFCAADAPTLADLQVNESEIRFYAAATGGTALPATTPLVNGATYYVVQYDAVIDCESATRLAISVIINDAPTPTTTDAIQDFCVSDAPTVADLQVNETGVVFYTSATGGTALTPTTALVDGNIYYASLTVGSCESATRLAITVNIDNAPTPTTNDATQDFCTSDAPTVADLQVNETGVTFYTTATGGTALAPTTALIDGTIYYASQTIGGCESATRLVITVNIDNAPTPTTTDTTQDFCVSDAPTVADLQVNETGVVFYTSATGGTALTPTTALVDGNIYYASLTVGSCESATRLAITVNIDGAPTPTTNDATQDFCTSDAPTIADIQVNETGVVFYTSATSGNLIAPTTALIDGTIYYASVTVGSCESATRLAITVNIDNAPTPTTNDATQDFCVSDAPTVADLQVNETGVVFYTSATGGTALAPTTALVDGTIYYASQTVGGCESATRLVIAVNIDNAPTPTTTDATQDFCISDAPTVADLQVNETSVVFYATPTGGNVLSPTTALIDGNIYYASQTIGGCESATRLAITVNIDNAPTPTTTGATQDFCTSDAPTVADIQVNETGVVFYTSATGGTVLAPTTALVDGTIYYASLTVGSCESATRLAITVNIDNAPTPTTSDTTQDFCTSDAPTVADLQVNETGVIFYNSATGGTALAPTTALIDGTIYYASQTIGACESATRLAITVNIDNAPTPTTADTTQDFCVSDAPTVADLQVNETGVVFYTSATGGTALAPTTALVDGTIYYASQTLGSCESATRLAITVNIDNAPTPTTSDATQDFCVSDAPTVADLQVNETGVVYYTSATGGTALAPTTALIDGTIYYASQTVGICESATRLAITVNIDNAPTPSTNDATQDFCVSDAPTVADLQVNEASVVFYTSATGGTALAPTTALVDGTIYYASLTLGSCESATRLAITVNIDNAPTPTTTDTNQDFCTSDAPTVADIQVNETGVVFYTTATGGTSLAATTALVDGNIYYASQTIGSCESATRLAITVNIDNAPTPTTTDATQDFCTSDGPTIADIQVNETDVVFYTSATGGTALAPTTTLVDGTIYYASLTLGSCESATRLAITVNIDNAPTPTTTDTNQDFCTSDAPTVADLQVNETGVVFYTSATGGTPIAQTTALIDGTIYYASLTVGGCESATRLAITVNIDNAPTPTTTDTTQDFCTSDAPTVGELQVNETGVVFYTSATGGNPIAPTTALVDGTIYYASQMVGSCESATRLAITVNIDGGTTPTTNDTTQDFCAADMPTVANIQVNEPGVIWYAVPFGGTPLAMTDALLSGSVYYASLPSAGGCESSTRLAITVTLSNGITPTTSDTTQNFCAVDNPTVANIQVNQTGVVYYTTPTGGTALASTAVLANGATYYASYIDPATGCESATRLAIQVSLDNGVTPTTTEVTQQFCQADNATIADLQINETGVTFFASATGGAPLESTDLLSDGTTYYASIIDPNTGCASNTRLAVTVSISGTTSATITGGSAQACFGDEVTYTTQQGNTGYIWTVTGGEITGGGTATDNFVTVRWTAIGTGTVNVAYTDTSGCQSTASASREVSVISCSDIMITKTVDQSEPRIGDMVTFTIMVTNMGQTPFTDIVVSEEIPDGYSMVSAVTTMGTYDATTGLWDIPQLEAGETAILQVKVRVMFGGDYTNVAFIVSSGPDDADPENNEAEASTEPSCLTVYNEFSPNNDGINDFFKIDCIEFYADNKLDIYNRYGALVYKTAGYQNTWDGTANVDGVVRRNEKLPVGTYYYVLEVDGRTKTGWVFIMR